jgi:hypothetical protein
MKEYRIGDAVFFDDTPDSWQTFVGCPRPEYLTIHRDFPHINSDTVGDPLYGTLVRSDNEAWLRSNIDEAVAIVYFLGDSFRSGVPAECFAYQQLGLNLHHEGSRDLVAFWTKHGQLIESSRSLVLFPPLSVRGNLRQYRIDAVSRENSALLQRFGHDPYDRLVVAARQYFRTQFSDVFTSPAAEDYAAHCSALEAALGIDARQPGVGDRLTALLIEHYGDEPQFEDFFYGLYVARSYFVHGVAPNESSEGRTKESQAYRFFTNVRCKTTLMRVLTRDVIRHALGRDANPLFIHSDSALPLLRTILHSDGLWTEIKHLLTQPKAADTITDMGDEQFGQVQDLAFRAKDSFDWQCVRDDINEQSLLKAIGTCALLIARFTNSEGDIYLESDRLGRAADEADASAVKTWTLEDPWERVWLRQDNRLTAIQIIARSLARYFDRGS